LQDWFKLYKDTCTTYDIPIDDQYNMDEKGFMKGIRDAIKVLIPVIEKEAFSI
jgi:hypothetical protein